MAEKLTIIAGPCSVESEHQLLSTASAIIKKNKIDYFRGGLWKPRTRPGNFEGVGEKGIKWLEKIQKDFNIPVITEAGTPEHVELLLKHNINAFWIGARTVSNPFSVEEIANATCDTSTEIFIKNPIYPDIELWTGAIERFLNKNVKNVYAIHRGFYPFEKTKLRNIPRWEIPIELARRFPDVKIICDPSHIAGNRSFVKDISQKAIDLNMRGLMLESHINPDMAYSDKNQQLNPDQLHDLISGLHIRKPLKEDIDFLLKLDNLREKIDVIDFQLIDMLEHRFKLVDEIGELKKKNDVIILQLERWKQIIESRLNYSSHQNNIPNEFLLKLLQIIHKESIQRQNNIMNKHNSL